VKKKLNLIVALGILLAIAIGVAVWQMGQREPRYEGKPLSYWIGHTRGNDSPNQHQAALAAMGDKAVPFLIARLRWKPLPAVQWLSSRFPRFPLLADYTDRHRMARQGAVYALGVLGPTARDAIPALEALDPNADPISPWFGATVRAALASIKQEPLPPYIAKLKDTSDPGWYESAFVMWYHGTNAIAAIPNLIAALEVSTNDVMIRSVACHALSRIHSRPEVCVPALIPILRSPDPTERQMGLLAVAGFGSGAKPAWAELTNCLCDPYPLSREIAAKLLQEIDPEGASKAGVK
jgi:hypothetical protein